MKSLHVIYFLVVLGVATSCSTTKSVRSMRSELIGYQLSYADALHTSDSLQAIIDTLRRPVLVTDDGRTAELENLLAQREAALFEINSALDEAMSSFAGRGLTITRRDGKVYVSLEEKLLFESGKYELSDEGSRAVRELTQVLERNKGINITVEGHTDNVPMRPKKEAQIIDNWDLSCKRATSVVRTLLTGSQIAASRISASGRSAYAPLRSGSSPEARAANRRTEIILTPNIDPLIELMKKTR